MNCTFHGGDSLSVDARLFDVSGEIECIRITVKCDGRDHGDAAFWLPPGGLAALKAAIAAVELEDCRK